MRNRSQARDVVLALCVASLALCAWPAIAETYEVSTRPVLETIRPGGWEAIRPLVIVGTNGSDAMDPYYLAVSDGGNADSYISISRGGCAGYYNDARKEDDLVAVAIGDSGRTCYWGGFETRAYHGFGLLGADAYGYTGVSDTGDARGTYAVTGTGNCTQNAWDTEGACVSGTGSSQSDRMLAVSGTGDATTTKHCYTYQGQYICHMPVAASGTGSSYGGVVSVSGTGSASSNGISVAGGDAASYGGLACVSATGNCGGGSLTNVCPFGRCS